MAKKKKKPKDLKSVVIPKLRQASRFWPNKKEARNRAKVKVEVGVYKNGNSIYRTLYKCNVCGNNFDRRDTHMDHINPVIDPEVGFVDWNTYIARLFVEPEGYQCICVGCHKEKTEKENKTRKKKKKS